MPLRSTQLHWLPHPAQPVLPAALTELLDPAERQRAARFGGERERSQYVLSRVFERVVLAHHLGVPIASLRFARSGHGKPRLVGDLVGRVELSISHSDGAIVVALAPQTVGVDIERTDRRAFPMEALAIACEEDERQRLVALPSSQHSDVAYRAWTCKEAVLKADGRGLAVSPKKVAIDEPSRLATLPAHLELTCEGRAWQIDALVIERAWCCAVATVPAAKPLAPELLEHEWHVVVERALAGA